MFRLIRLLQTSIGKKLLMALSGLVLLLFVIGHMIGNLSLFIGQSALNSYAHWLQENPLLWVIRLLMMTIVLLHIHAGISLFLSNRRARQNNAYSVGESFKRIRYSFMLLSGLWIVLFLVIHIGQLTFGFGMGGVMLLTDSNGYADVYNRVLSLLHHPLMALFYLISIGFVAVHMAHAVRALFQTMGFYHDNYFSLLQWLAIAITVITATGFAAIPIAALLGMRAG